MKKAFLTVLLLAGLIGAGYASVRLQRSQTPFPPHTIVYKLTHYDEGGKLVRTDVLVRQVFADGSWKHTQVKQDGSVNHSKGQLSGPATAKRPDAYGPVHLNYKYIEEPGPDTRAWISPDLQDFLMFTALRKDGSRLSMMEAVSIKEAVSINTP